MVVYMSICPKCANYKVNIWNCEYCNVAAIKTNTTYQEYIAMSDKQKEELIDYYIKTLIKDTYDSKAKEYRDANPRYAFADYVPEFQISCPTCHSTNIQKISTGERIASVGMFGMFSNKINKSYKCKSCGYTW